VKLPFYLISINFSNIKPIKTENRTQRPEIRAVSMNCIILFWIKMMKPLPHKKDETNTFTDL
jgi:hypothetical protein